MTCFGTIYLKSPKVSTLKDAILWQHYVQICEHCYYGILAELWTMKTNKEELFFILKETKFYI